MRTLAGYLKGLRYALRRLRNGRRPPPPMNINSLNNAMLYEHLRTLNGRNLARMMATSRKYRNFIRADPRLMARINQARIQANRNLTRRRINARVAHIATTWGPNWALEPQHINHVVHLAMARNNHPLNNNQIMQIIFNVMH